jgi:hypothetical protein
MVSPRRAIRTYSDRRAFNCLMPTDFMRETVVFERHLRKCANAEAVVDNPQGYGILCLPPVVTFPRFIRKFGTGVLERTMSARSTGRPGLAMVAYPDRRGA